MNYTQRITCAYACGVLAPSGAYLFEVEHAEGCRHHEAGGEPCCCVPEITAIDLRSNLVLIIGTDGHVVERRARS